MNTQTRVDVKQECQHCQEDFIATDWIDYLKAEPICDSCGYLEYK